MDSRRINPNQVQAGVITPDMLELELLRFRDRINVDMGSRNDGVQFTSDALVRYSELATEIANKYRVGQKPAMLNG